MGTRYAWDGAQTRLKALIVGASLAIGFALAQSPPDPRTQYNQEQPPAPGQPEEQQPSELSYDGPSILSRDPLAKKSHAGKLLDFRFYAAITGVYDSGLTPPANAPSASSSTPGYGVEAGFGFSATRQTEHAQLSIEYRGSFREYARDMLFNGTDQFLSLAYGLEFHQHLTLDLKEKAGTTTLANGEFAYLPITNADLYGVPSNELFDSRTNYSESQVDLAWERTARLMFDFGGQGFIVRRDYLALARLNGYSAHAGAAYRLTRDQTVSANYKYTHFDFPGAYGDATLETAAIQYSIALSRHLGLALRAGGDRVDVRGLTDVTLDPAIAAIVGQNVALVTFLHVLYVPELGVELVQHFHRSSLRLAFSDGISPGNGIYLTSRQTAATMGYSYIGYRRLAMSANAGFNQLSSIGQALGKYTNLQAGGAISYEIMRATHLEMRYDYRHYTTQDSFYKMNSNRVSLGLAYGPGDTPLPVW